MVFRVSTIFSGIPAVGGGINQLFFSDGSTSGQVCVDAVQDFWDAIADQIANDLTYEIESDVPEFGTGDGSLIGVTSCTTEGPKTGLSTNELLPVATQGLLRLRTGLAVNNRILRGRVFIPAVVETSADTSGRPTTTFRDAVVAAGQALVDDASAEWVVWHRPVAGSGGAQGLVSSVSLWDQFAVLRSRRD